MTQESVMQLKNAVWVRMALPAVLAGGFLALSGASAVRAEDHECQERIAKADHHLHEMIEHHGWQSRQADHARMKLREAREHCWNSNHRWWDEDQRRWRTDRDWDDHDHDHDRNPH
jgi:hypothetical protein